MHSLALRIPQRLPASNFNVHRPTKLVFALPGNRAQMATADVRRRRGAGPCGTHAQERDHAPADRARVFVRGPTWHGQDFDRADFREGPELHRWTEGEF